jgi:peptidoglycan hydrolase-like protein with peptidoglycan-binding domain
VATLILLVGAGIGWAGAQVFRPAAGVPQEASFTTVELVDGEVGSTIRLNAEARWERIPAGTNQAAGTVTSVAVDAGAEVSAGAVLYAVDLRPVVVAAGETPAFRDLARSASGADVVQLQGLLGSLGFFDGTADGTFGPATERAVKAWQRSLGVTSDGVVRAGDIVFVPALPSRVVLDDELVFRGAALAGGEQVVFALSPEPVFTLTVGTEQAALLPVGTAVQITMQDEVWDAEAAGQEPDSATMGTDQVVVTFQGPGGASICGAGCALIPVEATGILAAEVVTVPTVTGVVAPSSALRSEPDGGVSVVAEDGTAVPVHVLAQAQGMVVVDGVPAGMRVRIPAEDVSPASS